MEKDSELIYDKKNEEHINLHQIVINEKDELFLRCLYDTDEFLSTMEIGEQTGLDREHIDYRYRKFGTEQYTELLEVRDMDKEKTPRRIERMKEAKLTNKGRDLIDKGLVGDPNEKYVTDEIVVTQEKFEELTDEIERLENRLDTMKERLDEETANMRDADERISENRSSVEEFDQWRDKINTFVLASRKVFKKLDVNFGKYLQEAEDETK